MALTVSVLYAIDIQVCVYIRLLLYQRVILNIHKKIVLRGL